MNIALDYDGTFTADPLLWLRFIIDAQAYGHAVHVVTMRYPSEVSTMDPRIAQLGVAIHCTSRKAKKPACDALALDIHVWIDDNPRAVQEDATQIWETQAPEGSPVVPDHG